MNKSELDALKELEAKIAYSVNWQHGTSGHGGIVSYDGDDVVFVCQVANPDIEAFICAARNALSTLIAEIERLTRERDTLADQYSAAREISRCGLSDEENVTYPATLSKIAFLQAKCDELRRDRERLNWVIDTGMWCLRSNTPNLWSVFVPGDQGEPDWKEIAQGKTPRESIDAAIARQQGAEGENDKAAGIPERTPAAGNARK